MKEGKIRVLLQKHYNLFHTELMLAAIDDDSISEEEFKTAVLMIESMDKTDIDEYVPYEFRHLLNPLEP